MKIKVFFSSLLCMFNIESQAFIFSHSETTSTYYVNRQYLSSTQPSYKWKNGFVYYKINEYHFNQYQISMIKNAMEEIQNANSVIHFVDVRDKPYVKNYINIISGDNCSSVIGMRGIGAQSLSLNTYGCMNHGIILHELMHALGFNHEQSRSDRDSYVHYYPQNVQDGKHHNFDKDNEGILK
ncbi:MAG: hypothetical protein DCC88_03750 [Spirobacillus cienkowskii]|jgi:hypothetical protein|uniref:Peptidase M12A domain-containing protein n=1 Tax=Spirobacillus cienkowskii TaxID=495820 RepID=A0A369KY89_9BACT|nr:MAG: hypothetical protein DCC88_03750 [Spirobacillus cienkowskii]